MQDCRISIKLALEIPQFTEPSVCSDICSYDQMKQIYPFQLWLLICDLIIIMKWEIWNISHCLLSGHEKMLYVLYVSLCSYGLMKSKAWLRDTPFYISLVMKIQILF